MYIPPKIENPIIGVKHTHIQILKSQCSEGMFDSWGVKETHILSTDDPWWDRLAKSEKE